MALGAAAQSYTPPADRAQDIQEYSHARIVRLSLVDGDVQVHRPEAEDWEQALVNLPLQQGYTLATGRGRAEVELESGATIRLAENTLLRFAELALADGARITRVAMTRGTSTFYANLGRNDVFAVTSPDLDVEITHNARFRVDVLEGATSVRVLKGDVEVESGGATYRVTKGRTLTFDADASDPVTLARSAEPDEFDRWVADRDEVVSAARSESVRYVRAPFSYGLADLTSYGLWISHPSYGNVWQPWGIGVGWSPYVHGRWVYVNGFGWTWVSYEPWGWVPYHYGRWVMTHRGWGWVPGHFRVWHPGLVAWLRFGDRVGWCPLGPGGAVQTGVVVTNTPRGIITGVPNTPTNVNGNNPPQFTARVPLPNESRLRILRTLGPEGLESMREAEGVRGDARAVVGNALTAPATESGPAAVPSPREPRGQSGIVYDREARRYVNNPRATSPPAIEDAPAPTVSRPVTRRHSATIPHTVAPATPRDAPAPPRTPPAARSPWGSRADEPRMPSRVEPGPRPAHGPPRADAPRPSPPPRAEVPRPSAPPRMEAPRPPASAPRSEAAPPRGEARTNRPRQN